METLFEFFGSPDVNGKAGNVIPRSVLGDEESLMLSKRFLAPALSEACLERSRKVEVSLGMTNAVFPFKPSRVDFFVLRYLSCVIYLTPIQ
jgi:hypothetical protein